MPRLSKTTSALIAAAVVSVAGAASALTQPVTTSVAGTSTIHSGPAVASAPGLRASAAEADAAARPLDVLFVGRAATLQPRGGATRSFACRAAVRLDWRCRVAGGPRAAVPARLTADVVVVVTAPTDDATWVRRVIDAVPAGGPRLVVLGPVLADEIARRRVAGIRALARSRDIPFIDPAGARWVSAASRQRYVSADGRQLTAAGHEALAVPLASALRQAVGR